MREKTHKKRLRSEADIQANTQRVNTGGSNPLNYANESSLANVPLEDRKREARKPLFLTRYE